MLRFDGPSDWDGGTAAHPLFGGEVVEKREREERGVPSSIPPRGSGQPQQRCTIEESTQSSVTDDSCFTSRH